MWPLSLSYDPLCGFGGLMWLSDESAPAIPNSPLEQLIPFEVLIPASPVRSIRSRSKPDRLHTAPDLY